MRKTTTATRELAELCDLMYTAPEEAKEVGMVTLMRLFKVEEGKYQEFYEIIACIFERIALARVQLERIDAEPDELEHVLSALHQIEIAISPQHLSRPWNQYGANNIEKAKIHSLITISTALREKFPLPKLAEEDVGIIMNEALSLREYLLLQQLTDDDHYRALMLEGIDRFCFRLKRLEWVGALYTFRSINWFLSVATILNETKPDDPVVKEIMKKTGAIWEKVAPYFSAAGKSLSTAKMLTTAFTSVAALVSTQEGQAVIKAITHQAQKLLEGPSPS